MIALGEQPKSQWRSWSAIAVSAIVALLILKGIFNVVSHGLPSNLEDVCTQVEPLKPKYGHLEDSSFVFEKDYKARSVELLAGAIRIPTVSYDDMDMDPTKDGRFKPFAKFHEYLFEKFPLTAKKHETVNTYGLLYTFEGTDKDLQPILLMAHQDVVPVNEDTLDKWDQPPFEGVFDGEFIYGRGTADTKNTLIATLAAMERLLEQKWRPRRTVLLSFGFDEECSGFRGAKTLAQEIEKRYGKNSIYAIVDEAFGLTAVGPDMFAPINVAEKGRAEFQYEIDVPGGHASRPPPHTGIGIMADLITKLEADPAVSKLQDEDVVARFCNCMGRFGEALPTKLRSSLLNLKSKGNRDVVIDFIESDPNSRFLLQTTQAIDVIRGGVKINALPETIIMQSNLRIDMESTFEQVRQKTTDIAAKVAGEFDLQLVVDGVEVQEGSYGVLNITTLDGMDPAPVSPYEGKFWDIMAGTTKNVFENTMPEPVNSVHVAPIILGANTDTLHYWDLSPQIYRWSPTWISDMLDYHTVNERLRFRSHQSAIAWYYEFLVNTAN